MFARKIFANGIIFSFEFHRKRIVAILELQKAFSEKPSLIRDELGDGNEADAFASMPRAE